MSAKINFISAGAGSGKTHRLTEILHRELTGKAVRPSGVIATTFTKKAATELRERVRGHLLQQGDFPLANSMGQARIGTVNAVCGQLIERFAFEAGMATEQQVLEEAQAGVLLGKAIDIVLNGPAMTTFLKRVRRLGLEDDWKESLQKVIDQIRSNDIPLDKVATFAGHNASELLSHFPMPTRDDLDTQLLQAIQQALPAIESVAQSGGKKNTNEYLAQIRGFERSLGHGATTWAEWVKLSKSFPEAGLKPQAEPIAEMAARFAEHPQLHADIEEYLASFFDLAFKALSIYAANKREMGLLDFTDQEHKLLQLLDVPGVAEVLNDELDLLMVDEFQDTSPIQLALFLKLARFAKQVYWVGDIKQAIYGFRGSDTELMQAILEALPSLGGSKEVLPDSWRSRRELVQLVNGVFSHAFANSLPPEEVVLQPKRNDELTGAPLANWLLGGKNQDQEATALVSGIRKLVESHYPIYDKAAETIREVCYGDIAVLSRSHEGVARIAKAMHNQDIPCATAQPGLLKTPEATLALACLRRLNDPGDTIASAEIVSLADCAEPAEWVADRLRYLQEKGEADKWLEVAHGDQSAHPLLTTIAQLRGQLPVLAPREALQTVMTACDVPARVIRWCRDQDAVRARLASLDQLLELCDKYEDLSRSGQHAASISGLILWLGEMETTAQDMLAEPPIDAVKVMTHHAAKGLEWPVVVLTDLAANIKDRLWSISAESGSAFDVQAPLEGRSIRYWPWPFGAQKKVAVADAIAQTTTAEVFRKMAIEESKRLLYVSMTRARDLLVLARSSRKPSGEWLDCLGAPWLLPDQGGEVITFLEGQTCEAPLWALDPLEEGEVTEAPLAEQLHWFAVDQPIPQRLLLSFNPSKSGKEAAQVVEKCMVGERMPIKENADMALLGSAIHACLALSFTQPGVPITTDEVERLLKGHGVDDCVHASHIVRQAEKLHGWIRERWPDAVAFAEYPVEQLMGSGQQMRGRMDLLLNTKNGWVLIDHKSSQLAAEHWGQLAEDYQAQLRAYSSAVHQSTGSPVIEAWLFLPVAGGAVRVV